MTSVEKVVARCAAALLVLVALFGIDGALNARPASAAPIDPGLDPKIAAVCTALWNAIQQTSSSSPSGPFAKMYDNTFCNAKLLGDNADTATFDGTCASLVQLEDYATSDASKTNGTQTATGLSPAAAGALAANIEKIQQGLKCAGPPPATKLLNASTVNVKSLIGGLEYYALMICVAVIFVSSALWAAGSKGQNPGQETTGKRGIITALIAALLIGGIPSIMSFVNNNAKQADPVGVLTSGFPSAAFTSCSLTDHNAGKC